MTMQDNNKTGSSHRDSSNSSSHHPLPHDDDSDADSWHHETRRSSLGGAVSLEDELDKLATALDVNDNEEEEEQSKPPLFKTPPRQYSANLHESDATPRHGNLRGPTNMASTEDLPEIRPSTSSGSQPLQMSVAYSTYSDDEMEVDDSGDGVSSGQNYFSSVDGDAFRHLNANDPNKQQQQQTIQEEEEGNIEGDDADEFSDEEEQDDYEICIDEMQRDKKENDDSSDDSSSSDEEDAHLPVYRLSSDDDDDSDDDNDRSDSSGYSDYDPNYNNDEETPFVDQNNKQQQHKSTAPPLQEEEPNKMYLYCGAQMIIIAFIFSILAISYRNAGKTKDTPAMILPPPKTPSPTTTLGPLRVTTPPPAPVMAPTQQSPGDDSISKECANLCQQVACCHSPNNDECNVEDVSGNIKDDFSCEDYKKPCQDYFDTEAHLLPNPEEVSRLCQSTDTTEEWTNCNIACGPVRCCFDDISDCQPAVKCGDYEACSAVFEAGTDPPPDPSAVSETCADDASLVECHILCSQVSCCSSGERACGDNDNIKCEDYPDCQKLQEVPEPERVEAICRDDIASSNCRTICQTLSCCSIGGDCSSDDNIDCDEYPACQQHLQLATTTTISGTPPDPADVAQACQV